MVIRTSHGGGGIVRVTLDRPNVRNAFDAELIAALREIFARLGTDPSVRVIILEGAGTSFCGGADVQWMRAALDLSAAENVRDAELMAEMFATIDSCPKPVIGRVHGAALGGGAGLAAVCDIVVSTADTVFGFTETKLGIIPAVISPFVIAKIGVSAARALFLSGARFDGLRAREIGLVHELVASEALDARIDELCCEFATAGPHAVAAAKALIATVAPLTAGEAKTPTARAIAERRTSDEGQEGLRAFLARRLPSWVAK